MRYMFFRFFESAKGSQVRGGRGWIFNFAAKPGVEWKKFESITNATRIQNFIKFEKSPYFLDDFD